MNNIDSINHVTGKSVYLDDIPVQKGTLHAAIFGSPVGHGKIVHLDVSAAEALSGVVKVFTYKDITGKNQIGGIIEDESLFAEHEVSFNGEAIALVVAKDEHTARKALKLIDIKIEELAVIIDPRVAKEKGQLLFPSRTFRLGDIASAWSKCDYIFEGKVESFPMRYYHLLKKVCH